MTEAHDTRRWSSMLWGLFLILLGSVAVLHRLGWTDLPRIGELWPLVFFVLAAIRLTERRFGSTLTFLMLGSWFFAVNYGWMGMTYENSWGLVLVAVGLGIVVRALTGERPQWLRDRGERHD